MPLFFLIAIALVTSSAQATVSTNPTQAAEFTPCRIGTPPTSVAAECTDISVPFSHDLAPEQSAHTEEPLPEKITLAVARISARGNAPAEDPVTIIAGGPGQSALDSWPQLQSAFYPLLANRDVYLIDPRGTGDSMRLDCPAPPAELELNPDLEQISNEAKRCLESQPLPVEWFTTSVAVRDLDAVREALGIEHWNLYGVSYGCLLYTSPSPRDS